MLKQQPRLTQPLHRATLSWCLGQSDLCPGVSLSTCRHVPFATDFCLFCYVTTVKHFQINQRKVSARLLLGQELYAEQQHVVQSNSSGGAPNFLVLCTVFRHFRASRPVTGSSTGNGRDTFQIIIQTLVWGDSKYYSYVALRVPPYRLEVTCLCRQHKLSKETSWKVKGFRLLLS
jgi:hypothetical protein